MSTAASCTESFDAQKNNCGSIPWSAYNSYFGLIKKLENGNMLVKCMNCVGKTISVSKSSPSNMKVHLERKHGSLLTKLSNDIEKLKTTSTNKQLGQSTSKQQTLLDFQTGKVKTSSQDEVNKHLVNWIVDGLHSFSEVERPSFICLWKSVSNKDLMCRTTLMKKIKTLFFEREEKLTRELEKVDYVCTAADSWTCLRRSFIGVTCHWIDPVSFERKTVALACKRIIGKQTNNVLAKELSDVFFKFKIQNKNLLTITDNGSNYVKAFTVFGSDENFIPAEQEEAEDNEGIEFLPLTDVLDNIETCESNINLSGHRRCAAHTLNLIAVKDSEGALKKSGEYRKLHRSAFAKAQALWNKSRTSSKSSDIIKDKLGVSICVPNATRWNSVFDSVNQIASFFPEKESQFNNVCDALGLPRFNSTEIEFFKEYVTVMKPLAKALDILQGETNISIGYLLPTLTKLIEYVNSAIESNLKICEPLAQSVKKGIQSRFEKDFEDKELILAACLHPRFKLDWLSGSEERAAMARSWMKELCEDMGPRPKAMKPAPEDFDGFFTFSNPQTDESGVKELARYLEAGLEPFPSMASYKNLSKFSVKYNTPLPSSAAVERLFSYGKEVFSAKRNRMTDSNFEMQLLLKFNEKLNLQ